MPIPQTARPGPRQRLALALANAISRLLAGRDFHLRLSTVTSQVDDTPGWKRISAATNERDASEMQQLYTDALTAWRKNPLAKRVIDTITDYCLGDGMVPDADGDLGDFITRWWNHPKNQMPLRMVALSDELARAGDLFVTLHRNPEDGLSYVRPIPKDQILHIETLPNDWETEIAYHQAQPAGDPIVWLSPDHPNVAAGGDEVPDAIMVHYAVNRVVGALLGESDLSTMIPWMLRYSRLLESRVRLHWALRAFLWIVTVPANKVAEKAEQYATPPEHGSVLVTDDTETWNSINPHLGALDASADLRAVRQMVDAGSGLPPHWRGEATDVNLATAKAMEHSASRHLRRRQLTLRHIVTDLCYQSALRARATGKLAKTPALSDFSVTMADLDRQDNQDLARAARSISTALSNLSTDLQATPSDTLRRRMLEMLFKFAGEPISADQADAILAETPPPPLGPAGDVDELEDGPKGDQPPK